MLDKFDPYRKWLGIPPQDQPPNHYRLLGIALFESDPDVIENAAIRQMSHVRTFQSGQHAEDSQRLLNELATAKLCLIDADKRAAYDQRLRVELERSAGSTPPPPHPPAPPSATGAELPQSPPQTLPVTAARAEIRTHHARRARKKNSLLLPLLVGLISLTALVAVILMAANLGTSSGKPDDSNRKRVNRPKPATTHTRSRAPEPAPIPNVARRAERFRNAVRAAREAFRNRDLDAAQLAIFQANSAQSSPDDKTEVQHLRDLRDYLDNFSRSLREAIYSQLDVGDQFQYQGQAFKLEEREGELITFTVQGRKLKRSVRELDAEHAVAFAVHACPESDVFAKIWAATFLALDHQGSRERAEQLWQEAAEQGHQNPVLARELGRESATPPAKKTGQPGQAR